MEISRPPSIGGIIIRHSRPLCNSTLSRIRLPTMVGLCSGWASSPVKQGAWPCRKWTRRSCSRRASRLALRTFTVRSDQRCASGSTLSGFWVVSAPALVEQIRLITCLDVRTPRFVQGVLDVGVDPRVFLPIRLRAPLHSASHEGGQERHGRLLKATGPPLSGGAFSPKQLR